MQAIRKTIKVLALGALLSVGVGCATHETATERDFGKSVRSMIDRQTLNPMESMLPDPQPIEHGNGDRLNKSMEAYKTDVSTPSDLKQFDL